MAPNDTAAPADSARVDGEEARSRALASWRLHLRQRQLWRLRRSREKAANRPRKHPSYSRRVTSAFALIAAMTALILASILAIVWMGQFQSYTHDNMQRVAQAAADQIGDQYAQDGEFSSQALSHAASIAQVSPGLVCRVVNQVGTIMYEDVTADEKDGGAGSAAEEGAVEAPIYAGGEQVGTLSVWAHGSGSFLTQYDAQFRFESIRAVLLAAIIAIVIALFTGFIFARNLVDPLKRVTVAANRVKEGDLSARTGLTGDDEISQLGETFDAMVEAVELDRKHERQLTTDVAHELRTPLMAIQANVEGMLDGVFEPDAHRLSIVNSETVRLSRLVSALLELSHLESGTEQFTFEEIDLGKTISQLVESQQPLFDGTDLSLEFESDDKVMVIGDADKLRQATLNLISNAVRYSKDSGTVRVEVHHATATEAVISVTDQGIGIAPEDLQRVFSRFWRADAARDRASGGLGVGLAVVKEIIGRHHGRVDVESELGEGTTFYLYVPYKQPEGKRARQRNRRASLTKRGPTGRHDAKSAAVAARKAEKATKKLQRQVASTQEKQEKQLRKAASAQEKRQRREAEARKRQQSRADQSAPIGSEPPAPVSPPDPNQAAGVTPLVNVDASRQALERRRAEERAEVQRLAQQKAQKREASRNRKKRGSKG